MTNNDVKQAGDKLIELAELLTDGDTHYMITADELLENITGRSISEEQAGQIKVYLNT